MTGASHWGLTEQTLAMLDSALAAGQEVVHDVYPYTAFSTFSDILFPGWRWQTAPVHSRAALTTCRLVAGWSPKCARSSSNRLDRARRAFSSGMWTHTRRHG